MSDNTRPVESAPSPVDAAIGDMERIADLGKMTALLFSPQQNEYPAWTIKLMRLFWGAMFRDFKPRDWTNLTSGEKGQLFGFGFSLSVIARDHPEWILSSENGPYSQESMRNRLATLVTTILPLAQNAFVEEISDSTIDSSAFLAAFGLTAHRILTRGKKLIPSPGTLVIYLTMLVYWREIASFKSRADVHRLLLSHWKEANVSADPRTIAKTCERIGLKFKSVGRPKKIATS